MERIKLSVHPLTFAFGFYYALTGRIFEFVIYTLSALIHELGHSFVASSCGYKLDKIILMPFGAVVLCDTDDLKPKDHIKIALAGPIINICIGLLFIAFWWIAPESYAFTDIVVQANLSLALINLIPALPLDGGRVVFAMIKNSKGEVVAKKICKILGFILFAIIIIMFILSLKNGVNISLILFALVVLFGTIGKRQDAKYVKVYAGISTEMLKRGVPYKRQAVEKSISVQRLLKIIDAEAINEIVVFDEKKEIAVLSQEKINSIIENGDFYSPISKYMA